MSDDKYKLAGWIAILNFLIVIILQFSATPLLINTSKTGNYYLAGEIFTVSFGILLTCILIYVMSTFRKLLKDRFNFSHSDKIILIYICLNVIYFIFGILDERIIHDVNFRVHARYTFIILIGIVSILFSLSMVVLKENLSTLKYPLILVLFLSGAGLTSVYFFTGWFAGLGVMMMHMAILIIGIIFLRIPAEVEFV